MLSEMWETSTTNTPAQEEGGDEAPVVMVKMMADNKVGVASALKMDFEPSFATFRKKEAPVKLVWRNLEYSVGGRGKKRKEIINRISGEANPGEVVALMGVRADFLIAFKYVTN